MLKQVQHDEPALGSRMQIVRTVLWVLLGIVLALFAVANWNPVEVRISQTLILETKLPVLVIGAFVAGLLPMWLVHRTASWRHRRRIATLEGNLTRQPVIADAPPVASPMEPAPTPGPAP
jgi:lipopolysaccharide assembly protein A